MVKASLSSAREESFIPGQGAKILDGSRPKTQNIQQKQYCNKLSKDFKNGPHQKKKKTTFHLVDRPRLCVQCFISAFGLSPVSYCSKQRSINVGLHLH